MVNLCQLPPVSVETGPIPIHFCQPQLLEPLQGPFQSRLPHLLSCLQEACCEPGPKRLMSRKESPPKECSNQTPGYIPAFYRKIKVFPITLSLILCILKLHYHYVFSYFLKPFPPFYILNCRHGCFEGLPFNTLLCNHLY